MRSIQEQFLEGIEMITNEAIRNSPALSEPVPLNAYFDESGNLCDEIVSFGGCAGTPRQTLAFHHKWKALIDGAGVGYVSMKDAVHFKGPFGGWHKTADGKAKRDSLLRALARTVVDCGLLVLASSMTSAEFKALPKTQQKRFWDDNQYCQFETCITGLLHQRANPVLHIVCDLSEKYAEKCITLFNLLRKRDPLIKARCIAISFADDQTHTGLQAADMISYCARVEHQTETSPKPIVQEIIDILRSPDRTHASLIYRDGDELGEGKPQGL